MPVSENLASAFLEYRNHESLRKSRRRDNAVLALQERGVAFKTKNRGYHLVIACGSGIIDFWPGTGLWRQRGTAQDNRGLDGLLARLGSMASEIAIGGFGHA